MPTRRAWHNGWWQEATHRPSPNWGPRPPGTAPTLVVVHAISLPPGHWRGDAVERFFTNTLNAAAHPYFQTIQGLRVSAHFFVRRSGRTLQFVSIDQRAWHAGVSTWRGRDNCNDWSVGIELEGLDGLGFELAQYRALARLLRVLRGRCGVRSVVGHEHIAPGRKFDPGPGFDWRCLRRGLHGASLQVEPWAARGR